jgi:two-component system chemotaxis sensor kinase CheA
MTIDLNKFIDLYFEECQTNVAMLQDCLRGLVESLDDEPGLALALRSAHSIKSASAAFGFDEISSLSQAIEDVLRQTERGVGALTAVNARLCLDASLVLCALLLRRRRGESADPRWVAGQIAALEACQATNSREAERTFLNR